MVSETFKNSAHLINTKNALHGNKQKLLTYLTGSL